MARGSITRAEAAYDRLRSDITAGRWLPDTILSTYSLSEDLGMSRTPINGALKRLEGDGLIEVVPQVGCRVLRRDRKEVSETLMIRAALEALAAELAAPRITERELAALEDVLRAAESAAAEGDVERYEAANVAFHRQLAGASRAAQIERILSSLWTLGRYQLGPGDFLASRMLASCAEHREILSALRARDPAAARQAADDHLRRCSRDYLEYSRAHASA